MTRAPGKFYKQCEECKHLLEKIPKETQDFLDEIIRKDIELGNFSDPSERELEFSNHYCKAYPFGIPNYVYFGHHDHSKPYKGDKGILFEPKNKENK